jgi:hypothetical protein
MLDELINRKKKNPNPPIKPKYEVGDIVKQSRIIEYLGRLYVHYSEKKVKIHTYRLICACGTEFEMHQQQMCQRQFICCKKCIPRYKYMKDNGLLKTEKPCDITPSNCW